MIYETMKYLMRWWLVSAFRWEKRRALICISDIKSSSSDIYGGDFRCVMIDILSF